MGQHRAGGHRRRVWLGPSLAGLVGAIALPLAPTWVFWTIAVIVVALWTFVGICEFVVWRRRAEV